MQKRVADFSTVGLTLIILIGAALRFGAIGSKTLWLDEAFSIWVAKQNIAEIRQWLIQIDQHPPLYYMLLHFWIALVGDLQGAVRALSALCGTLAIPLFYAAGKAFFNRQTGLIAALLLAVAPFHVRFAQETRMYALLTLEVVAALYFLGAIMQNRRATLWHWIGLSVAQAAIMLTHNTAAVYFPLALNLAILVVAFIPQTPDTNALAPTVMEKPSSAWLIQKWLPCQFLALLLWSVWARAFVVQAQGVDAEFWISPPTLSTILGTLHTLILAHLPRQLPLYPLADLLFWGVAAYGVYAQRRSPTRVIVLLLLFATPILVSLLVSLRRPIFYDRTLIWVTLPFYLLMAVGIEQMGRTVGTAAQSSFGRATFVRTRLPQMVSIGAMILLSGWALTHYYLYFEKEEWDKAAHYLAERVEPGDVILFNATWVQLPFEYYFRHYDRDVALRGLPVDLFDRGVLEPKMTEEDVRYMHQLIADQPRVWLVYSHEWYTDPQRIVLRELQQLMQSESRQRYEGVQILEFRK